MLNLTIVKTAVLTGLLALAGGATAVYANATAHDLPVAQEGNTIVLQEDTPPTTPPEGKGLGEARQYFRDSVKEVTALALGISVEELETARENRELRDLMEELGVEPEDIKTAIDAAWPTIVAGAEEQGLIDSDQAARLIENGFRLPRRHGRGHGPGGFHAGPEQLEQMKTVVADVLGITVEELEEAHANGQRLPDLIEELGLDETEVREQLEAAKNEAIQQAVEDGTLTPEQAERLQNRPQRGEGRGQGGFGPGGQGQQGSGQGSFAPPPANNS